MTFAFFPCIRFETQILLWFRGDCYSQRTWNDLQKLEKCLELHKELNHNYELITKLAIIFKRKNLKLIIENPYSEQHYLSKYWCLKPKIIDYDRRDRGDYYEKPTQYWFINCEPKNNMIMEYPIWHEKKKIIEVSDTAERSLISKDYANRFIREFIL